MTKTDSVLTPFTTRITKLALTLSLAFIAAVGSAQGLVRFANTANTLISYGGLPPDPPVGPIQPFGAAVYYFALLTAPAGTTNPLAFQFAGLYATNTAAASGGRIAGGSLLGVMAPGWAPGEIRAFEVAGWSANLGPVWNPSWLAARPTGVGEYFGVSAIAEAAAGPIPGGDPWPLPLWLFGTAPSLASGFVLVGQVPGWAQPRITALNSSGELTWTNFCLKGLYSVESAGSPAGPWNLFAGVVDTDPSVTNSIKAQLPLTNAQAFYRVAWTPPDPVGVWDYRGYDGQGALVITGQLNIPSMTLVSSNPPNPGYVFDGQWQFQYAGPPTNNLGWLGPQLGTGWFSGTLDAGDSLLYLWWPTNVVDANVTLSGDIWGNCYTGSWLAYPLSYGHFTAVRLGATNSSQPIRPAQPLAARLLRAPVR